MAGGEEVSKCERERGAAEFDCRWTVSETSRSGLERLSQAPTHPD